MKLSVALNLGPISILPEGAFPKATSPGSFIPFRKMATVLPLRAATEVSTMSYTLCKRPIVAYQL